MEEKRILHQHHIKWDEASRMIIIFTTRHNFLNIQLALSVLIKHYTISDILNNTSVFVVHMYNPSKWVNDVNTSYIKF